MVDVSLVPRGDQPGICVYCRDELVGKDVACPACGVRLHPDCRADLSRCPTTGCGGRLPGPGATRRRRAPTPVVPGGQWPPRLPATLPSWARGVGIALLVLLVGLVWLVNRKPRHPRLHEGRAAPRSAGPTYYDVEGLTAQASSGDLEAAVELARVLSIAPRLDPLEAWQTLASQMKREQLKGVTVLERPLIEPLLAARGRDFGPTLALDPVALRGVMAALRCRLLAEAMLGRPRDPAHRVEAAEALGRSASQLDPGWLESAAAPLARAAVGRDADLRAPATQALARFLSDAGEPGARASVRGYRDALHTGIAEVQVRALKALGRLGPRARAARSEIEMLLELSGDDRVRSAAIEALARLARD